ncbi:MAG TPA: transglycosylase SLT domain-containing protein [Polyangiales bacterium]|nr:transglycosylase SLT domain-containing protein [Polyangiales bacterium]
MTASSRPTPQMRELFDKAAKRWNVPVTLLMGIARVETGFDADFAGPATARGMFRATDEMREAVAGYMPADASDLEQQITLAAVFLSVYLDAAMWAGNRPGAIMSFYFAKGGEGPYGGVIEAGAGRAAQLRAGTTDGWPPDAAKYLAAVQLARRQFSDEGLPQGSSDTEKLYHAMAGLEAANGPEWCKRPLGINPPHITFAEQMVFAREWFEWSKQPLDLLLPQPQTEHHEKLWGYYEVFFELAPVTNASTPAPWRVVPKAKQVPGVLAAFAKPFEDGAKAIGDKLGAMMEAYDEGWKRFREAFGNAVNIAGIAGCVLIFALGSVYILVNRRG